MNIRNITASSTVLLMAVALAPGLSFAGSGQLLSIRGGAGFPTSVNDFSTSERIGPTFGGQYLYNLDSHWGVGAQGDWYQFGEKDHPNVTTAGGTINQRSYDDVATLEIMGRYTMLPAAKVTPYVTMGVGANYFRQKSNGEPLAGSTWADTGTTETRWLQNTATVGYAYSVGLGIEDDFTPNIVLALEGAWNILGVSKTTFGTADINFPTVVARIGWRLGG